MKLDLKQVKEDRRVALEHWNPHRDRWKRNMRMYAPEYFEGGGSSQWSEKSRKNRENRPMQTINILRQPVQQIVNDARQNKIGPRVVPVDGRADAEMAQVIEDWIRGIDYQCRAHVYDEYALEMAAACGFGFIGVSWEYEGPYTTRKKVVARHFPDPCRVLMDPFMIEPDGRDAKWAQVEHFFGKDEFKRRWKDVEFKSASFEGESPTDDWIHENGAVVVELWQKHFGEAETLYATSDGREFSDKELAQLHASAGGFEIVDDREVQKCTIWQHWTNGEEDLEDPVEWVDNLYVPIVPVWGQELWVEGKRTLRAVIEDSHGAQETLNYLVTKEIEMIGQMPLSPRLVPMDAIKKYQKYWDDANTKPLPYLPYESYDSKGNPTQIPQRDQYEPAIQGYSLLTEQMVRLSDATHGIQPSARGETDSQVKSGRHAMALQSESDMANFHIHDNLARAIEHRYRIMSRVAPKLETMERAIRIVGEDHTEETVRVVQILKGQGGGYEGPALTFQRQGEQRYAPLDPDMFDFRVNTGPSLNTRRQESAAAMIEIRKTLTPDMQAATAPMMIREMDFPNADKMADACNRALPPQLREPEEGEQQIPPEVMQQMQQAQQVIDSLTQAVNQLQAEREADIIKIQGKLEETRMKLQAQTADRQSKEQIEAAKIQLNLYEAQLQAQQKELDILTKVMDSTTKLQQGAQPPQAQVA